MTELIATRWGGGACPYDAGWRKVMMWGFIVTDGLLFGGFLASYGYGRMVALVWPRQADVFSLPYIAAMTFVLITSSVTMVQAVRAAGEGRRVQAVRWLGLTIAGGLAFLGMQAFEWRHLIVEGARL